MAQSCLYENIQGVRRDAKFIYWINFCCVTGVEVKNLYLQCQ